jgi:hypothetical protein
MIFIYHRKNLVNVRLVLGELLCIRCTWKSVERRNHIQILEAVDCVPQASAGVRPANVLE